MSYTSQSAHFLQPGTREVDEEWSLKTGLVYFAQVARFLLPDTLKALCLIGSMLSMLIAQAAHLRSRVSAWNKPGNLQARRPSIMLIGLCNPGNSYAGTRHNVGASALELLATSNSNFSEWKLEAGALISSGRFGASCAVLARPVSFMNLSGRVVAELIAHFGMPLERVVILHDELDLPPGRVKVKRGGGSGGHRGVASCIDMLGADFWRVRIGVGRPAQRADVPNFVLSKFTAAEHISLRLDVLSDHLHLLATNADEPLSEREASVFMNALAKQRGTAANASVHEDAGASSDAAESDVTSSTSVPSSKRKCSTSHGSSAVSKEAKSSQKKGKSAHVEPASYTAE